MDVVIALDAGTTGVRAIAFSPELEELASSYRTLTNHFPAPGYVEHDLNELSVITLEVLSEIATWTSDNHHHVRALGITNQRETTVAIDRRADTHDTRAIVWQDRRTSDHCDQLRANGIEPMLRDRTGLVADSYFSATKMSWLIAHGALQHAQQPGLGTIDTFIVWLLTGGAQGGRWLSEPSNASRTLLVDLVSADWCPDLAELFNVPLDFVADIIPSIDHFGDVSHPALSTLRGVPIMCVMGDQQAALFGHAALHPGLAKATYGTGSFLLAHAGDTVPALQEGLITTIAWDLGIHGPLSYAYEGSAFVAGAAIQWLRDELGIISSSAEINELAARVADSAGVSVVPAFSGLGSPQWRSDARGTIMGLSRGVTREHLARATLEALAFQVRAMTDAFAAAGVAVRELRADGGAAASDLLMSVQATASRLVVRRSSSLEATARGAAGGAALATGLIGSLDDYAQMWTSSQSFEPDDPLFLDLAYDAWCRAAERA